MGELPKINNKRVKRIMYLVTAVIFKIYYFYTHYLVENNALART